MPESLRSHSTPNPAGFRDVSASVVLPYLGRLRAVDVREPHEFRGELGHVHGAELVPLQGVESAAAGWSKSAPLLLICRSGGRSARAATVLAHAGFTELYNLTGGMLAWNDAGLPVDR